MTDFFFFSPDVAWSMAVVLAWIAGEFCARWTGLPRISIYGLVGFFLSHTQIGFLPSKEHSSMLFFANVAFGLILFELGYRINLRWLRINPWVGLMGLVESISTFIFVYYIASWYGTSSLNALLLASLSMSTSPAGVLRVINEQSSSGQVTERILYLSAINCVLAVLIFKVIVSYSVFKNSGNLWEASSSGLLVLLISGILGAVFGLVIPSIMRWLGNLTQDGTAVFALAVVLLVAGTHAAKLSPVLATLIFGLVARHRRIVFSQTQRNFGALGELLTVFLFVFVVATLEWQRVWEGINLGLILIVARFFTKTLGVVAFSHVSGIPWRKGLFTGLALAPISVFVILVLEQARYLGVSFVDELAALATMTLFLEILGPVITQRALIWAKETPKAKEG